VHEIEKEVWTDELADMHKVIDEELKVVRQMAASMALPSLLQQSSIGAGTEQEHHDAAAAAADFDDENFDVDSMRLKPASENDAAGQSSVPELYLAQTPVVDGHQSLAWHVFIAFHSLMLFIAGFPLVLKSPEIGYRC